MKLIPLLQLGLALWLAALPLGAQSATDPNGAPPNNAGDPGQTAQASPFEQAVSAIEAMRLATNTLSPTAAPMEWAGAQNRLGGALFEMAGYLEGAERHNLLEQAAEAFRAALSVLDREKNPEDWSLASLNLANTLLENADLVELVEAKLQILEAIQALKPLDGIVPEEYATLRAAIAARLGDAHAGLARRGAAASWSDALDSYRRALERLPPEPAERAAGAGPSQRGLLEYRLALSQLERARLGVDGAPFHADALASFERASQSLDSRVSPELWAALHRDWADALLEHAVTYSDERAVAELDRAVGHFETALQLFTQQRDTESWRRLQNNLAAALLRRAQLETEGADSRLQRAGQIFGEIATVTDRAQNVEAWAQLQHNLGLTFRSLGRLADQADPLRIGHLERAASHLRLALEVFSRDAFPRAWAETQTTLALTLQDLARLREPAEAAILIDEASALLRSAREVLEPKSPPPGH